MISARTEPPRPCSQRTGESALQITHLDPRLTAARVIGRMRQTAFAAARPNRVHYAVSSHPVNIQHAEPAVRRVSRRTCPPAALRHYNPAVRRLGGRRATRGVQLDPAPVRPRGTEHPPADRRAARPLPALSRSAWRGNSRRRCRAPRRRNPVRHPRAQRRAGHRFLRRVGHRAAGRAGHQAGSLRACW